MCLSQAADLNTVLSTEHDASPNIFAISEIKVTIYSYHTFPFLSVKVLMVFLLNPNDPCGFCIQGLTIRSQTGVYSLFD